MPLERVLEPEVMDGEEEEARAYDAMDHREVNAAFVGDLLATGATDEDLATTLDVGTGTALIPIELCRRAPRARVVGIDLAPAMLRLGRRNIEQHGLSGVIALQIADAKALPFADGVFGCVVSNTILHHVLEPSEALAEMIRVLEPGGLLFVRDLVRPVDETTLAALVARHATGADGLQRSLLEASLRAALTVPEVRQRLSRVGLPADSVRATSDRHWSLAYRKLGGTR